jgi:hypothetical protein
MDIDVIIVDAHIVMIQIHVENNVVEDMSYYIEVQEST